MSTFQYVGKIIIRRKLSSGGRYLTRKTIKARPQFISCAVCCDKQNMLPKMDVIQKFATSSYLQVMWFVRNLSQYCRNKLKASAKVPLWYQRENATWECRASYWSERLVSMHLPLSYTTQHAIYRMKGIHSALNPSGICGYCMLRLVEQQILCILPTQSIMCSLSFSQQTANISLHSFHRLLFLMETHSILCEVQTDVYTGHNDVN